MAKKVTLRFGLKEAGKLATVSIHKQSYKIVLDGMVSDFKSVTHFFPRSITTIEKFDADNRENQFLDFLDVEVDKWFAEKEGYTDKEYITVVSEEL